MFLKHRKELDLKPESFPIPMNPKPGELPLCYRCRRRPLISGGTAWCRECTIDSLRQTVLWAKTEAEVSRALKVFGDNLEIPVDLVLALEQKLLNVTRPKAPRVVLHLHPMRRRWKRPYKFGG